MTESTGCWACNSGYAQWDEACDRAGQPHFSKCPNCEKDRPTKPAPDEMTDRERPLRAALRALLLDARMESATGKALDAYLERACDLALARVCDFAPSDHFDRLIAERDAATARAEQLTVQLAGCGVAALGGTSPAVTAKKGDYGWSCSYQDTLDLRRRYEAQAATIERLTALTKGLQPEPCDWPGCKGEAKQLVGFCKEHDWSPPAAPETPVVEPLTEAEIQGITNLAVAAESKFRTPAALIEWGARAQWQKLRPEPTAHPGPDVSAQQPVAPPAADPSASTIADEARRAAFEAVHLWARQKAREAPNAPRAQTFNWCGDYARDMRDANPYPPPQAAAPDEPRGLYRKYEVRRLHDPSGKHEDCEYYVLDWKHDPFTIPAMSVYADACAAKFPVLAASLRYMVQYYGGSVATPATPPASAPTLARLEALDAVKFSLDIWGRVFLEKDKAIAAARADLAGATANLQAEHDQMTAFWREWMQRAFEAKSRIAALEAELAEAAKRAEANAQAVHDIAHALQACSPPGGDPCASTCEPKPVAEIVAKAKACEWAARDLARLRKLEATPMRSNAEIIELGKLLAGKAG